MKVARGFWISLIITTLLFIAPTVLTYGLPYVDGMRLYGFPLPFYSWGGRCRGECDHEFKYAFLLIDIALVLGIPLIVNYFQVKKKK